MGLNLWTNVLFRLDDINCSKDNCGNGLPLFLISIFSCKESWQKEIQFKYSTDLCITDL